MKTRFTAIRQTLHDFRAEVDTRTARLRELDIAALDGTTPATQAEAAALRATLAAVPTQLEHLATVETKALADLVVAERRRVDCDLRRLTGEYNALAGPQGITATALDRVIQLHAHERDEARARLRAEFTERAGRINAIQREIDALKVDDSILRAEQKRADSAIPRGKQWVA